MKFILLVQLLALTSLSVTAQTCVTPESMTDQEILRSLEEKVEILRSREHKDHSLLLKVAVDIKCVLEKQPEPATRSRLDAYLDMVQESLGLHDLYVASFYMNGGNGGRLASAASRLQNIAERYRKFSKMDEVLVRLMVISVARERQDEAVRYGWELICNYPLSEYVPKTFERLNEIGVSSWQGCENFKR
jgi:outer membrane protein assembly factor BamD (BamD/ComL family)